MELEEVDDVEIVYEETENGRVMKFKVRPYDLLLVKCCRRTLTLKVPESKSNDDDESSEEDEISPSEEANIEDDMEVNDDFDSMNSQRLLSD